MNKIYFLYKYYLYTKNMSNISDIKITNEEELKQWINYLETILPEQNSQEWLDGRCKSIGGSEMHSLLKSSKNIIMRKIGLPESKFPSAIQMVWGSALEDLTQLFVSYVMGARIYNAPGSIPSRLVHGKTFSPDGLGFVNLPHLGGLLLILFEFKTLWSRRINQGVLYSNYEEQVRTGLSDLGCVQGGIYAESLIRICSWNDMMDSKSLKYNTNFHKKHIPHSNVLADGFLVFYYNTNEFPEIDNEEEEEALLQIENMELEVKQNVEDEMIEGLIDYGKSTLYPNSLFDLFNQVKRNRIKIVKSHIRTYPDNFARVDWVEDNDLKLNELHSDHLQCLRKIKRVFNRNTRKILGVLPYKLFDLNITFVMKDEKYTSQYQQQIQKAIADVQLLRSIENEDERREAFEKMYPTKRKRNNYDRFEDLNPPEIDSDDDDVINSKFF
jgi:hypothetical protein